jgi:hypothetical protein
MKETFREIQNKTVQTDTGIYQEQRKNLGRKKLNFYSMDLGAYHFILTLQPQQMRLLLSCASTLMAIRIVSPPSEEVYPCIALNFDINLLILYIAC